MDSKQLALRCRELAENKKAEDIVVLDLCDISSITDYFVICSGNNDPHLRAIVDEIRDGLQAEHGLKPNATDGDGPTSWVVLDYFDVIVHVMRTDIREHYKLEALWGDAAPVKPRKPRAKKPAPDTAEPAAEKPAKAPKKAASPATKDKAPSKPAPKTKAPAKKPKTA